MGEKTRVLKLGTPLTNYFEVTKPRTWVLLVYTALGGIVVASRGETPMELLALVLIAVAAGSAGANTITSYIDRDIDEVMNRTKRRPLPTKRIYPAEKALYYGLALSVIAIVISYMINLVVFALMMFSLADNIIIYSKFLKRRNPVSIILGGFSGGAPALIGYAAIKHIDLLSLSLAALVVLWIPSHIWSLALRYKDDYERAKVPMLPVVVKEGKAIRCIASTVILMVAFSLAIFFIGTFSLLYLITAIVLGVLVLMLSFWLVLKPSKARAWLLFKLSSPYLALIFTAMMIDSIF